jgi:hypothetical protein
MPRAVANQSQVQSCGRRLDQIEAKSNPLAGQQQGGRAMDHRPRERNGAAVIAARCRCSSSGRPTSELWTYQTEARAGGAVGLAKCGLGTTS